MLKYCQENLELPNPDYIKKKRLGLWLGKTPKTIKLYRYSMGGRLLNLPYGCLRKIPIDDEKVTSEFHQKKVFELKKDNPVSLYDYQQIAVDKMVQAKFGILVSPAGSGKTRMGLALIQKMHLKTLWVAHTNDLIEQAYQNACTLFGKSRLKVLNSEVISHIPMADVSIGFITIQSLLPNLNALYNTFDMIIIDECHHCCGSPDDLTMYYKALSTMNCRHKFGLTATPYREDGLFKAVEALLGDIVVQINRDDCSSKIRQVGVKFIETEASLCDECLDTAGRISFTKTINYLTKNTARNRLIIKELKANKQYATILLSDRVEHLESLFKKLPSDMQKDAIILKAKYRKPERAKLLQAMRDGKYKYMFATYQLAKEGLDIPILERAYFLTPHKDKTCIIQCIGRVARVAEKSDPVVVDFVDKGRFFQNMLKQRVRVYRSEDCYEYEEEMEEKK